MATFEEMSAWSSADIAAATRALLPEGVGFSYGWDASRQAWYTWFFTRDPETGATVPFEEEWGMDERVSLFNAYGKAWAYKTPENSVWTRRTELTRPGIPQALSGYDASTPEDLDPDEIDAVLAAAVYPRTRRAR